MSNEEDKIRQVKEWVTNFPGAQQHWAPLLKLRSGPLKGFIDQHLVGRMRCHEWIGTMNGHFHLEELRKETERERRSLESDGDELNSLELTLVQLRLEEEALEKEVGRELHLESFPMDSDWKVQLLRKEAELTCLLSVLEESRILKTGLGKLTLTDGLVPHQRNNHKRNRGVNMRERLDGVKESLSGSFLLSARGSHSRGKALELRSSATTALDELNFDSTSGEEGDLSGVTIWSRTDLEEDKTEFQSQIEEMKGEKVSRISQLVDDWTFSHVSLSARNQEVSTPFASTTQQLQALKLTSPQELSSVLCMLMDEKEMELTYRHFVKLYPPTTKEITTDGGGEDDPLACQEQDESGGMSPFPGGTIRNFHPDEFPFALTCSLFKTWPNLLRFYRIGVENEKKRVESWAYEGQKLKAEIKRDIRQDTAFN